MFLNKKIINFEDKYIGLDVSDFSVKVFQLEKKAGLDRVRSYGCEKINPSYIEDGRIIEKEKVSEIIKNIIKKAGPKKINTKKVICSVAESKVFLRILSIPKVNEEETREAIKWEIEASIPLSVDQVYFDWQFLNQEGEKQNILTVAVSKEIIDNLSEVLVLAGLSIYGFEMESTATTRSIIPKNIKNNEARLVVDMGEEKTSFIIVEGNVPYFTSSIPFSSSGVTETISNALNVSKEEAEKIKTAKEDSEHPVDNNLIFNSIKPFLENLAVEVEKTIDFYQNMPQSHAKIEKIVICGGGANLKGLLPYLITRLKREIIFGNPWVNLNMGKNLPIISKDDSIRYATALGLAMRPHYKISAEH
jgi:type IV pilus assembly protein PilM